MTLVCIQRGFIDNFGRVTNIATGEIYCECD